MTIVTVTLNPAIDQTIEVDHFTANAVNRVKDMQQDAGGKGVNVASFLADYGSQVTVTGFLGEKNPELFEGLFTEKKITDRFVRVPGRTRTNIKIMDYVNQQTTDINMAGQTPTAESMRALVQRLEELAQTNQWFVLSGNLPPGVPANIYGELIHLLKAHGRHVVLDTSREALNEGVKACPQIVKPNIDELREMTGAPLTTLPEIETAARVLLASGIELVVISMGKQGALFVDRERAVLAIPPRVMVKTTVGAGDAMVAGIVAGKSQGLSLPDCARLATAFSVGAITHVGAHLPDAATLQAYVKQVTLQTPEGENIPSVQGS